MADSDWTPTTQRLPQRDQRVDWIDPSGEAVYGGMFAGGVWLLPGGAGYVDYTPTFWRPAGVTYA
jgi:hypothetical protein